jgi:methyltransferase (TIGR00027 family)
MDTVVFEVDHFATQGDKRKRIGSLHPRARTVRFVGVDFERDHLGDCLAAAGHDASARTTWIWEGVTPYLTSEAIDATLDIVAKRSARGSVLVMTYATPERVNAPRVVASVVEPMFRVLGEPIIGLMSSEEVASRVRAHEFEVEDDAGLGDLSRRYAIPLPRVSLAERVLVARRSGRVPDR